MVLRHWCWVMSRGPATLRRCGLLLSPTTSCGGPTAKPSGAPSSAALVRASQLLLALCNLAASRTLHCISHCWICTSTGLSCHKTGMSSDSNTLQQLLDGRSVLSCRLSFQKGKTSDPCTRQSQKHQSKQRQHLAWAESMAEACHLLDLLRQCSDWQCHLAACEQGAWD